MGGSGFVSLTLKDTNRRNVCPTLALILATLPLRDRAPESRFMLVLGDVGLDANLASAGGDK